MFYDVIKAIVKPIVCLLFRIKVYNRELEPKEGAVILCGNHLSLLDPVLLGIFVKRKVSFMAKEELFKIPVLSFFIKGIGVFPVSRGTIDLSAMKMAIKTLREGRVLGIFPEGGRVHKLEEDAAAKGGVGAFAYKTKATVFPAHIVCEGRIKFFKKIKVIYGKPITFEELGFTNGNSDEIKRISQEILDKIYSLVE